MEAPVYHIPALLDECINGLNIKSDGVYADVTFGGGGHSRAIMSKLGENGRLLGFDQDIDALRIVSEGVNRLKSPENAAIVITHYQRLLDYIVPDYVHVLANGRIVKTGTKELALELEEKGYAAYE